MAYFAYNLYRLNIFQAKIDTHCRRGAMHTHTRWCICNEIIIVFYNERANANAQQI